MNDIASSVSHLSQQSAYDVLITQENQIPIQIPSYQRAYCWEKKQVEGLLESIWYYDWQDGNRKLHLGTIVVHEHKDVCDIVDGQQRLITLSIIMGILSPEIIDRLSLLCCTTDDENMLKHVRWAALTIRKWVTDHPNFDIKKLNNVTFDVIKINGTGKLSLAYTFFNAINSAGKKLSDYDLLKSHHLRFLDKDAPQAWLANEWDLFIQEKIKSFNGEEATLREELLDFLLYRLRRWIRNRDIRNDRGHVFEHYSAYENITGKCPSLTGSSYATGIIGGMWFFLYVKKYVALFRRFVDSYAVQQLYSFDNAPRHNRLLHVIRALLFLYYCKFCSDGELYLNDALMFIIQRIGRVRNAPRITERLFKEPIVLHTVEALDESPTPEHFFRYCVLPTNLYVRDYGSSRDGKRYEAGSSKGICPAFWQGAFHLYKKLESGMVENWFDKNSTFIHDFLSNSKD